MLNALITVFALSSVLAVSFATVGYVQQNGYEHNMRKHCEQYYSVPEKHLDRVPDGCVPQYFEHKPEKEG